MDFSIIEHGSDLYYEAVKLRESILRSPFGLSFSEEEINAEKEHVQVVGMADGKVFTTAVLLPESHELKMQRVVVDSALQGKGFGTKMMRFCEEYAMNNAFGAIYVHARDTAVSFYLKNNYIVEGDYFMEDTIPHLKMRQALPG